MPLALILAGAACGGKRADHAALPTEPVAAVRQFLEAVRVNDLNAMGLVWGTDKGPAVSWMKSDELQKRLMTMRAYLVHDSYRIEAGEGLPGDGAGQRMIRVQLSRQGCTPVVPFTTVRYRDRWLVLAVDLDAAGNPRRSCR